jgi:hypothetical protein
MRLHHALFIICLAFIQTAQAFELIMVQAVSDSKKTFITRNGKRQGVVTGLTATFTAEDVSILAKAINVTGNFTQWEVTNPEMILPFEKGTIVTYYRTTEQLWALAPEKIRQKYIRSQMPKTRSSLVFKSAITRGLSESVSEAPATQVSRGGIMGEIYYERDIAYGFAFDVGLRYEREVVNYEGASFTTNRGLLVGDLLYYFDTLREYIPGKLFLGLGAGYGMSNTQTTAFSQSGVAALVPTVKAGLTYPFNETWEFLIDGAFESLQTIEEQEDGREQSTTQTNFKTGIGLRRYF